MSRVARLLIVIPANARPSTDIDLRALCAPAGHKAPAHLRIRFPAASPAVSIDSPAVRDRDSELIPAAAAVPEQPPEEAYTGASVDSADQVSRSVELEESLDTESETQRLAEDVSRFVDQEELAAASSMASYKSIDDEDVDSLSGGVLAGFGTLAMAIVTLMLLTSSAFLLWNHLARDKGELEVAANDSPVLPINIKKSAERGPAGSDPRSGQAIPKATPKATAKAEIDPETLPEAKAGEPEKKAESGPELRLDRFVGIEEDPESGQYPGFAFRSMVGVEEDEPGLVNKIETLRAAALAAEQGKRWGEALKLYSQILAVKAQDLNALFRCGTIHYKSASFQEAEDFYKRALNIDPEMSNARNNYGLVLLARGQRADAKKAFEAASKQANPDALTNLGNEYARDGKILTAASYYRRALVMKPDHKVARYGLALALLDEDESKARQHFLLLAQSEGVGARAQMMLGKLAHDKGQLKEAIKYYKRSLERDPKFVEVRMNYAMALLDAGQPDSAVKQMSLVVSERPKDSVAWTNMGIALMKSGDRRKAKRCYEYALTLDKRNSDAHFNYARCAESFGNNLIALEEYEEVLKLDRFYWQASYNIGLIYLRGGKYQKALTYFDTAVSIRGSHSPSHLNRAKALFGLRRTADGKSALKTYLLLAPKSDPKRSLVEQRLKAMSNNNGDKQRQGF
jgi:tetratricopeptide (TPR) repeat protein